MLGGATYPKCGSAAHSKSWRLAEGFKCPWARLIKMEPAVKAGGKLGSARLRS
jgi:hypothetical protein